MKTKTEAIKEFTQLEEEKMFKDNLGIGIANAVWVGGICAIIIFRKDASLWLLAVPIIFNWHFIEPNQE